MNRLWIKLGAVLLILGCISLIWFFFKTFFASSPNVQVAIISFISAVVSLLYTQSQSQKREIQARHFSEKRTIYLHFIGLIFSFLESNQNGENISEEELIQKMNKIHKDLLIWGSPQVIEAFNNFSMASHEPQSSNLILLVVDKLYGAIRKDLGHNDSSLQEGDLVGIMLNAEGKKQFRNEFVKK